MDRQGVHIAGIFPLGGWPSVVAVNANRQRVRIAGIFPLGDSHDPRRRTANRQRGKYQRYEPFGGCRPSSLLPAVTSVARM